MTLLQLVNRVLKKLREDQVTDLASSAYAQLVAEFVADAHREVVQAHDWSVMDKNVLLALVPGQTTYALYVGSTDIVAPYTGVTRQALVRYLNDSPVSWLFAAAADVTTGTPLNRMEQATYESAQSDLFERISTTARPCSFAIREGSDGLELLLDTSPDANYWLLVRMHDPELEIDVDTDEARELLAPTQAVYTGALYYALNERGEEMGEPGNVAERRYINVVGDAKETDIIRSSRANTHEMYRD